MKIIYLLILYSVSYIVYTESGIMTALVVFFLIASVKKFEKDKKDILIIIETTILEVGGIVKFLKGLKK